MRRRGEGAKMKEGRYNNANGVVPAGLPLLEEQEATL
ncbi:MAG TPA: type II toxin-antitoxin system ParD family antitoxin, partial [Xanthobacteraceae bacterium]|nr:type II toxin-antitoxin system ParD family antitoxin [Xanthobacteraceae bacterium]